jgi:hypothetical protein
MTLSGLRVGGILTSDTCPQLEEDELFMDLALDSNVFHAIPDLIYVSASFCKEEFYIRRLENVYFHIL